jgi:hypothetical protein
MQEGSNTVLTVVCAWCNKPMATKPGDGQRGVSHSICAPCKFQLFAEYLERDDILPAPVLMSPNGEPIAEGHPGQKPADFLKQYQHQ